MMIRRQRQAVCLETTDLLVLLMRFSTIALGFSFANDSFPSSVPMMQRPVGKRRRCTTTKSALRLATVYDVPESGWTSPTWNWGYAVGTGHDCARICRARYARRKARAQLVHYLLLLQSAGGAPAADPTTDVEEVKLTLALAWQKGRWDGSDGDTGGYRDVLSRMAEAMRYEVGDPATCQRRLLADMQSRFSTLKPTDSEMDDMMSLSRSDEDVGRSLLVCSGLVLQAMGFVERGI
jgi:hypothetical protein